MLWLCSEGESLLDLLPDLLPTDGDPGEPSQEEGDDHAYHTLRHPHLPE